MVQLPTAAVRTLAKVAQALEVTQDDWWVFGGTAVALHGLDTEIADVDVLLSARDAERVLADFNLPRKQGVPVERFRSDIWARWTALPLGVDLMAGLQVRSGDRWVRVAPVTREAVVVEDRSIYVPSREELIGILRLFRRPKDLARAEGLSSVARSAR